MARFCIQRMRAELQYVEAETAADAIGQLQQTAWQESREWFEVWPVDEKGDLTRWRDYPPTKDAWS